MLENAACGDRYKTYRAASSVFGMTYTDWVVSPSDMSEQGDRLKLALKEAGRTMRDAEDQWGWNYNTLKSNANGSMPFSYEKAQFYAARLKVRAEWLYAGTPPMRELTRSERRTAIDVPVIGWVQAGTLTDATAIQDIPDLEKVVADGLAPGEWFATDVRGDSMDRVSPEGSRIFVNARDRRLVDGRYYLFSLRGETTYKRYFDKPVRRLEPFSTNPLNRTIFPSKDDEWLVIGRVKRSVLDFP